jgi:hypothetical protein
LEHQPLALLPQGLPKLQLELLQLALKPLLLAQQVLA